MVLGGVGLFVDHKKGEIPELKKLLRDSSIDKDPKQKRAVMERVVGYMTLGIDMSPLFSEMTMATATRDLVQKKMAYLYLSNYASLQAELALLVINTLQKDAVDEDPMVRGLALRCLCSLHVNNLIEYIIDPILRGLKDLSPYVRKSAVMCVLRIRELSEEMIVDRRLVAKVFSMLQDKDTQVVANSIHVLLSLQGEKGLEMMLTQTCIIGLLKRLRDFNEWSQCLVLHVVSSYRPQSTEDLFEIMNFLDERLRHNNSAVVMAAVKVFLRLTADAPEIHREVLQRIKAPLVTHMTGGSPEVAYVICKHVLVLAKRSPGVFEDEFNSFFVRYSDPQHVQRIKIKVLAQLADNNNYSAIVKELSALVGPYDPDLSSLSIDAIGDIGVKLPDASPLVYYQLESFLKRGIEAVCAQSVIVSKDLMRKYPTQAGNILPSLAAVFDGVKDPRAQQALVWVLGQFGEDIPEAPYLLEEMIEEYSPEVDAGVRVELLSAAMKLTFKRPAEMQTILGKLLKAAIDDTSNVDIHDRALLYHRLLAANVGEAKRLIMECTAAVEVEDFCQETPAELIDTLFDDFGSLSVVYGTPAGLWLQQQEIDSWSQVADPSAPPLSFDRGATVTPQEFQSKWLSLPDGHSESYTFPSVPPQGAIESCLALSGVKVMATGAAGPAQRKFFFYGVPQGTSYLCMCEALLDEASRVMSCKFKADENELAPRMAVTFQNALQGIGAR